MLGWDGCGVMNTNVHLALPPHQEQLGDLAEDMYVEGFSEGEYEVSREEKWKVRAVCVRAGADSSAKKRQSL